MQHKALIYCRVSSDKQKKEGHGLESQEHRCRDYAHRQSYAVEHVFQDSFSGGGNFMKRPAMSALLAYLDTHAQSRYVVIFDDLKRFARDTVFHWQLRKELDLRGATVECLNFKFEDTPEGEFIETILAAQGQLEREQNRRQVIQKQKARLEKGYWAFTAVDGYKMERHPAHGKILTPVEPRAAIVREALEGFASGRFAVQTDVRRFLQESDFAGGRRIYLGRVERLLRCLLYAGYVEYAPWGISRRKGQHEPLISLVTYQKIQDKLDGRKRSFTRKDMRADFTLRGSVVCAGCLRPLTGSVSMGRRDSYPYYRCRTQPAECPWGGKSIAKAELESAYGALLKSLETKPAAFRLACECAISLWEQRYQDVEKQRRVIAERDLIAVRKQIAALLDKIAVVSSDRVIKSLEDKVDALGRRELLLTEEMRLNDTQQVAFGTAVEAVLGFLKSPYSAWCQGDREDQIQAQKQAFSVPCVYDRDNGFGTTNPSLAIRVLWQFEVSKSHGVDMLKKSWNQFTKYIFETYEELREHGCAPR